MILLLTIWATITISAQDSLRIRLDSLLQDPMFETSQVGLMVYDLTADSVYYQHNARQLLRPASTMKLVTAITALDQLGSSYQFRTRLYHTGTISNGCLNGDIYCVGGFDPMVDMEDVKAFAHQLHTLGVDTLRGRIVTDCSMKEDLDYGEGWCWDDDNPRLKPLMIGRQDIFVDALVEEMMNDSISIEQVQVTNGRCPADATPVATRSHTIDQVLIPMMKQSDNYYAEALFYQIAASTGRRPAKASDGRNVVKKLISHIGLGSQPYKIADGSGLSLYNYLSAELETMQGPAEGNVRAKTGTLTGISSLAGYCEAENGHQLCFSIINQGVMRNADGKAFQDRFCQVLCGEKEEVKGVKEVKRPARSAQKRRGRRR